MIGGCLYFNDQRLRVIIDVTNKAWPDVDANNTKGHIYQDFVANILPWRSEIALLHTGATQVFSLPNYRKAAQLKTEYLR